jgi:paraquat-inducible protein A
VHKGAGDSIGPALALSATGLLLYLPAILLPLMTLETLGMSESGNVLDTLLSFFENGYYFVSFIILISAVVFPLLLLSLVFTVSFLIRVNCRPAFLSRLFRAYIFLQEWAMVEIYLLGIMVTIMKMRHTAEIHFDPGFYCFTALVLVTMAIASVIDREQIWSQLSSYRTAAGPPPLFPDAADGGRQQTALQADLVLCHVCRQLQPGGTETAAALRCCRCGARIHGRRPDSIALTWALILTSALLLIPANLLPIMRVEFLGIPKNSTIVDGIIFFFKDGSYLVGLIIMTASVFVPVFKIVGLGILLLTVQTQNSVRLREKTMLFRFITFIGRWSMLDIFVIALLTVLVNFGLFTSIHAAPAATYFCIVVTSTMFAAITFDPRLMWDRGHLVERSTAEVPPSAPQEAL